MILKSRLALMLVAALAANLYSQPPTITLPATVEARAGKFCQVPATTNGKLVRWFSPDPTLDIFPTSLLKDTTVAVVVAERSCTLYAYTALADEPSLLAVCKIVIIGTPPPCQPPPCLPPPTGDFAKLEARSRQLVTALNDPETAKALSATLDAATKLPGLDLDAARTVVISRIASTLLARSPESRRTKNWEGGWRKPIEIEILALHSAGRLPDTAAYFAAIKSLAESLK